MMRIQWKNDKGQTVLEYILMISVSVFIGLAVLSKLNDYLIKKPNSVLNGHLNKFKSDFSKNGGDRYKKFPLRITK
jgi:hypothetical protein